MWIRLVVASCAVTISAVGMHAQAPSILVTPSRATLLVGEPRTFRAVGAEGRPLSGVHWRISPVYAAEFHARDEIEVASRAPTEFVVVAEYEGQEDTASVKVIAGDSLPPGTIRWGSKPLPGFRAGRIVRAAPVPDGPAFYEEERGASGSIIRAFTSDGREMWRWGGTEPPSPETVAERTHSFSRNSSVCDTIAIGVTKNEVAAMKPAFDYSSNPLLYQRADWTLEEPGVVCHIYFDSSGKVAKKRSTLTNQ